MSDDQKPTASEERGAINAAGFLPLGISLGLIFGVVFGLLIFDNIGLGISIGLAIGAGLGVALSTNAKNQSSKGENRDDGGPA